MLALFPGSPGNKWESLVRDVMRVLSTCIHKVKRTELHVGKQNHNGGLRARSNDLSAKTVGEIVLKAQK